VVRFFFRLKMAFCGFHVSVLLRFRGYLPRATRATPPLPCHSAPRIGPRRRRRSFRGVQRSRGSRGGSLFWSPMPVRRLERRFFPFGIGFPKKKFPYRGNKPRGANQNQRHDTCKVAGGRLFNTPKEQEAHRYSLLSVILSQQPLNPLTAVPQAASSSHPFQPPHPAPPPSSHIHPRPSVSRRNP